MPSSDRSSATAYRRSIACPACRAIICSTPCSTPATRCTVVHTRHEQGAAYMALGAALATGKPAVYSVVPGPGFLNSTAALATAYSTGAQRARADRADPEPRDRQGPWPAARDSRPDRHPAHAHQMGGPRRQAAGCAQRWSARAFQQLQSGRPRPVGLEVPPDMLAAKAEVDLDVQFAPEPEPPLDEDAIARAAAAARQGRMSGDLRRWRRQRGGRGGARARRAAHRAGRRLSPRQGRAR